MEIITKFWNFLIEVGETMHEYRRKNNTIYRSYY